MKTASLIEINRIEIREAKIPSIGDDKVLIRMKSIGVCGSDVHLYNVGKIGKFVVQMPYILGHEPSGEVAAVGKNVTVLRTGDRVVIEPGIPCGECIYCRRGEYNLCSEIRFLAAPPVPGALAEYITYDPRFCFRIPDEIDHDTSTFAEPLSVGIAACYRGGVCPDSSVLVLGLGPIGQMCVIAARSFGARRICGSDPVRARCSIALETGADHVADASETDYLEELVSCTDIHGYDVVIDAAGTVETANTALEACRVGGTVVMVGSTLQENVDYHLVKIMQKSLNILGSYRYAHTYPMVLGMIQKNKEQLKRLISHNFRLEETDKAFRTALNERDSVMKIIVNL